MGKKYGDDVPTIGTKNLNKSQGQDVENAQELTPAERQKTAGTVKAKTKPDK